MKNNAGGDAAADFSDAIDWKGAEGDKRSDARVEPAAEGACPGPIRPDAESSWAAEARGEPNEKLEPDEPSLALG